MRGLKDRPASAAALSLILGMAAAERFHLSLIVAAAATGASLLIALSAYFLKQTRLFFFPAAAALASLGMLLVASHRRPLPPFDISRYAEMPVLTAVEGVVCSLIDQTDNGATAVLKTDSVWIDGQSHPAGGRCLMRLYFIPENLRYGDRIVGRGKLKLAAGRRNPGDFNYRKYLEAQNITALFSVVSPSDMAIIGRGNGNFLMRGFVSPVHRFAVELIECKLGGQQAALLKGLLLGSRGDIDADVREAFADLGVIHVLAVSGLHVGFVAALLIGLFGLLRLKEPWRSLAAITGLIFYAALTGFKPPVFRATIMATVYLIGRLLQKPTDLFNTLAVSAIVILILKPLQLFEPAFQLSFAAVLGIGLFYGELMKIFDTFVRRWREKGRTIRLGVLSLVMISASAQIATLPLTMAYFNRIPLYSLPANLLVVPTVQIVVVLGFIMLFLAPIAGSAASWIANLIWLLLTLLIQIVQWAARLPNASIAAASSSGVYSLIFLTVFFTLLLQNRRRLKFAATAAILSALSLFVWRAAFAPPRGLLLTFLDVGQGDAVLLQFPGGNTMLVDCGDCSETFDAGRSIVVPYLRRYGIRRLHTLVLTHPHADHIGGAAYLLQHFPIERVVWNDVPSSDPFAAKIDSLIKVLCLPIRKVSAGDTLQLDEEALVLVMHPPVRPAAKRVENLNNESIVLKCVAYGFSILLTGDAEIPAETDMLRRYDGLLRADILKLGHHGSATASGDEFRRAVAAKTAVVSVGRGNRFGLPSQKLLRQVGRESRIVRTDENGAVQFHLLPGGIERRR